MRATNHIDSEIGSRIRQARLVENLTQEGLAQKLYISFQQLQKYENGTNRVSSSRLWAIAQNLKIPITYFYEGLDEVETTRASFPTEHELPDRTIRVARILHNMSDGVVKDKIFDLIKAFSETSRPPENNLPQKRQR